ncbi:MAG: SDR family NAD(P)-dependent oxidoreductase [Peptococcaceae bacterium]|nr:SDR family NAD(P)-dependent oxidoreductase [Peptococcaceae bacterium]
MKSFNGKVAVITGAGSGIGRALALELARRGAKLALSDIDGDSLEETAKLVGQENIFTQTVDVANVEQVIKFAKDTFTHFGVVHQVYNNAGMASLGSILGTSYQEFENVLNINLWGVVYGTREFLPYLVASGEGHIINVASVNGYLAIPYAAPYVTSKFAVRGFSESLRAEMLRMGLSLKVTVVSPSGVKSGIITSAISKEENQKRQSDAKIHEEKFFTITAESCAKKILNGVARGKSRIRIGNAAAADRLVRLFPQSYTPIMEFLLKYVFYRR